MPELYLVHHGVDGQEWGKKNGPPYPLDKQGKADLKRQKKLAKIEKKRSKLEEKMLKKNKIASGSEMTNDELKEANERLALKRAYQQQANDYVKLQNDYEEMTRKKSKSEQIIDKYGDKIVSGLTTLSVEAGKSLVNGFIGQASENNRHRNAMELQKAKSDSDATNSANELEKLLKVADNTSKNKMAEESQKHGFEYASKMRDWNLDQAKTTYSTNGKFDYDLFLKEMAKYN